MLLLRDEKQRVLMSPIPPENSAFNVSQGKETKVIMPILLQKMVEAKVQVKEIDFILTAKAFK